MATAAARPTFGQRAERIVTDRLLGYATALMAVVVAVAVLRGRAEWSRVPTAVWFHLALVAVVLVLTPVMLLRRQGTRSHRILGWVWAAAMLIVAATSLGFNARRDGVASWGVFSGDFSPVHAISLVVLISVPRLVLMARRHQVLRHRRGVRGIVIGALLVAGAFTFPFGRLLGHWLFG